MPRPRAKAARNGKPEKAQQDRYFSRAVGKALDILGYLKRTEKPLSLHELTQRVGGAKTSLFRLLRTLDAAGYVVRNELGLYSLSADARALIPAQYVNRLIDAAEPVLKDLVREFRETASLAVLFDNHIEVVAVVESPQMIRMGNTVGRIIPPHASSLGKAITAFQQEERRERLLRSYGIHQFTPHTITDERKLRAEFDSIRAKGHATEAEESHLQGCCFGAPVLTHDNVAIAAISISIPIMRVVRDDQKQQLLKALAKAAQSLSAGLSAIEGPPRKAS